jgi:hypothetical protein
MKFPKLKEESRKSGVWAMCEDLIRPTPLVKVAAGTTIDQKQASFDWVVSTNLAEIEQKRPESVYGRFNLVWSILTGNSTRTSAPVSSSNTIRGSLTNKTEEPLSAKKEKIDAGKTF